MTVIRTQASSRRRWAIGLTSVAVTIAVAVTGWVVAPAVPGDLLVNGSFDADGSGTGWSTTDPVGVEVWSLGSTHVVAWTNWDAGSPQTGYDGPNFAEINANIAGTLYQDVPTTPGDVLTWKLAHRARSGNSGSDVMKVLAGPGGGSGATGLTALTPTKKDGVTLNSPGVNLSDTGAAWGVWEGEYTVPAGQTTTRFAFQAVSSANGQQSYGNFLDGIQFGNLGKTGVTVTAASPSSITVNQSVPSITYTTNAATTSSDWTTEPTCAVYAQSDSSYATPLTGTLAAGSYVTRCTGGSSANYYASSYVNGTLVVTAPAPVSGGGAPAPQASTPEPEPESASPSPSSAPASSPIGSLDPIANQQNTSVPPAGLPAGASLLLVNGVPTRVTVVPNATQAPTGLEVTGDGWRMKLVGHGDDADPLGLTEKQVLILQSDQTPGARSGEIGRVKVKPVARASGDGFKANSPVRFYLLPKTYLGQLMNNDQGSFAGDIPVPPGIKPGAYTLQMNGYGPDSSVRSLSIGVIVKPTAGRILTVSTAVYFDPLSPELSAASKRALAAVAKRARSGATKAVVVGYVQPTSLTGNDMSLSSQRARNVAAYLKSIGLGGTYLVSGDGVAKQKDATARRVNVTVTYRG